MDDGRMERMPEQGWGLHEKNTADNRMRKATTATPPWIRTTGDDRDLPRKRKEKSTNPPKAATTNRPRARFRRGEPPTEATPARSRTRAAAAANPWTRARGK